MANDGRVVIETELDTRQIVQDINRLTSTLGNINTSRFTNQMNGLNNVLNETGRSLEQQRTRLTQLRTAFNNSTNVGQRNQLRDQIRATETTVTSLESTFNELRGTISQVNRINLSGARRQITDLSGEFRTGSVRVASNVRDMNRNIDEISNHARRSATETRNAFKGIGESIEKAGDKISSTGDKLTTRVTAPLAGIAIAGVKVGMDFESAMSRVKAISGATGSEIGKLHDQALQLGKDTAFSAKEAANGMENLASAGFTTNQIIQAMPGMLDLAASSGEDLASSADIAASTLNGFGLAADQAGHVADVLAKNAGATNAAVKDTGEAMKYIAPVAQEAGWSLESVTAAIGEMANSGIKGSSAGTSLRSMFSSLVRPSDEAATAMEKMGFKAYDSEHKMKSLSTLITDLDKATANMTTQQKEHTIATLFGQEAMSGILTLIKQGSSGLDKLTESYKNSDGSAKQMAETMQDNAKSSVEQMVGSLETAAITVEETFAPKIIELANYIQDLANKFANLTPEQQEFYLKLAAGAMALGPVVKGVGLLTTGVGGMMKVIGKIAPLFTSAAVAEGALGAEATASSLALGGLGVAGGVTLAAITALGIGVAGVITYNELLSKSVNTSTDDLNIWEQAINSMTGNTIKSKAELQNMGLVYKDFGEGIGEKFKKRIEESTKAIGEFSIFLSNIDFDGVITSDESAQFTKRVNDLCTNAVNTINERQKEVQEAMSKMFISDDSVLDENEKTVLASLSNQSEEQIKQVTADQNEINKIYTEAIKKRGHLTDEEKKVIKDRYIEIAQIELQASQEAKTQQEQSYLKHDFTNRANNLSAADGSTLLKDQRKKLDEQQIKDKTNYDVNIDTLKAALAKQTGEVAKATQAEIDKFTEKKNKVAELEQQQWDECIATIERENPNLVGIYNKYNGEILSETDKKKEATLQSYKDTFSNMNEITETGMYSLYNVSTGKFNDVYVTVDKTTKQVTGAWSTCMTGTGGYTKQMADDAEKAALAINLSFSKVTQGLEAIKRAVANIPTSKKVNVDIVYTSSEASNMVEEQNYVRAARKAAQGNYTGTNSLKTGLSHVDEHGYETANNDNVKMLGNGLAYLIGNHYSGGDGINPHMTTVNEMDRDITDKVGSTVGKIINTLMSALSGQSSNLKQVADNTNELIKTGEKGNQLNEKLATDMITKLSSDTGSFTGLQKEITTANDNKSKADKLKAEDYSYYATAKSQLDVLNGQLEEIQNQVNSANDDVIGVEDKNIKKVSETEKKQLEAQKHILDAKKDSLEKEVDLAKETAENEIKYAKESADVQVKIAEAKKDKLTKLAEATATAIKAKTEKEKAAADKVSKDRIDSMQKEYDAEIANIDKVTAKKTKAIDEEIAALEEKAKVETREDERKAAIDNILMLSTKMANTKSQADKDSLALQIKKAQNELNDKETTWSIEDEKAALEEEKALLQEKSDARKASLKEDFDEQKANEEEKLKSTNEYYDKLLETDSINAQVRFLLLQGDQQALVELLNSYAPGWQDAGQSLVDSLLNGLNSGKQSVQDAVNEMLGYRGGNSDAPPHAFNTGTGKYEGYATGTSYNPRAGLYKVDEQGFETTSSGSVAYVSKGASINNNMQSKKFLSDEISRQVALMRESYLQSQAQMQAQLISNITNANNSKTYNDHGQINFNVENFNNYDTKSDIGQISNELGSYRQQQKKF